MANTKIRREFLDIGRYEFSTLEGIDGTTTPQAVGTLSDGNIASANASSSTVDNFTGFVKESVTVSGLSSYLATGSFRFSSNPSEANPSFNHTVNAGSDRIIIVMTATNATGVNGNTATASAVSWGGTPFTNLISQTTGSGSDSRAITVWYLPVGDSGTNETQTLSITIGSITEDTFAYYTVMNADNVDQANPILDSAHAFATSSSSINTSITPGEPGNFMLMTALANTGAGVTGSLDGEFTEVDSSGSNDRGLSGWASTDIIDTTNITTTYSEAVNIVTGLVALKTTATPTSVIGYVQGIVDGFSGLTPGSTYYVQDTAGTIGTSAGSTSIPVGRALSATELLITD